jgi:hypothetical protein
MRSQLSVSNMFNLTISPSNSPQISPRTTEKNKGRCRCDCECYKKSGYSTLAPKKPITIDQKFVPLCKHFSSCPLSGTNCSIFIPIRVPVYSHTLTPLTQLSSLTPSSSLTPTYISLDTVQANSSINHQSITTSSSLQLSLVLDNADELFLPEVISNENDSNWPNHGQLTLFRTDSQLSLGDNPENQLSADQNANTDIDTDIDIDTNTNHESNGIIRCSSFTFDEVDITKSNNSSTEMQNIY